jgi:isocitrate/isopropylmalate dehydrogenase
MNILLLEGDGIGPEIAAATARVLAQVNDGLGLDLKFSFLGAMGRL